MQKKVYIKKIYGEDMQTSIQDGLCWLGWKDNLKLKTKIFLKPNFTYPFYKEGVTTSPQILEALVAVLTEMGAKVWIGEADGGSYAWTAEEAFEGHKVPEICTRYGARAVNLSKLPREMAETNVAGRRIQVELPSMLLHDIDVFITMPVPKVHIMTGVSLAFKNQWGCIPDVKRLRYHPDFPHVVLAINKLLRPKLAVFDGTYFLNRTGPMDGEPVPLNLLIVSDDLGAGDLVCCEIMKIDPNHIEHLRLAMWEGMMPRSLSEVELNTDPLQFNNQRFVLKRTLMNWIALTAFRSKFATWLLYQSKFAKPVHDLAYLIRGRPKDFTPQW
jgi:uncharacterized protein (DUF362 family)